MLKLIIALFLLSALSWSVAGQDIHEAAGKNDFTRIQAILDKSPEKLNALDSGGYTPLHWAGIRASWQAFEVLLAAGARVDIIGADGGTVLHWTCHHDNAAMVQRLVDAGADIHHANQWGRTPLHVAARRNQQQVASLLIGLGADVQARTREGWTPLHVANKSGHERMIALLLAKGADRAAKDEQGKLAADYFFSRPAEIAPPAEGYAQYAGSFQLTPRFCVNVWLKDGRLYLADYASDELYPTGRDSFFCRHEPWKVVFHRDAQGQVSELELHFLRRSYRGGKVTP